ncbi:hypothetical protein FACS1894190_03890 [Spirochaetia bacterium]|nr:hypothetical protein FACS1894190_03890 [Spirochaetia bacterium]
MADKLDWLNKHLVLLRYITVADVAAKENYKIRPDLAFLFEGVHNVEDMVFKFAQAERFKEACEFMPYIAHRRAAVWWVYRCVLSLIEELKINPAEDRDIADIGADLEVHVPDWAKFEMPEFDFSDEQKIIDSIKSNIAERKRLENEILDPKLKKTVEDAVEFAFQEFKKVHGIHPVDLLKKACAQMGDDLYPIDPKSPLFVEAAKLKAQLGQMQKETVDTIKSVLPPKVPAHEKKVRDDALDAVYRWICAPDKENSQKCLDVGNECPDKPAGLLSLAAFWSFGDLMPMGEHPVPTPPGLAANGLSQVLLMCALHQGGTRKLKERYALYFQLGVDVLTGADNWEDTISGKEPPHKKTDENGTHTPPNAKTGNNGGMHYKRWQ